MGNHEDVKNSLTNEDKLKKVIAEGGSEKELQNGMAAIDITGDNMADVVLVDTDDNGIADTIVADTNNDGHYDTIVHLNEEDKQ